MPMHAIFVRNLKNREPSLLLASDIEDAVLAEGLVRSIARSYPANGCDEVGKACWFRDGLGLHQIWCEALQSGKIRPRATLSAPHRGAGRQLRPGSIVA